MKEVKRIVTVFLAGLILAGGIAGGAQAEQAKVDIQVTYANIKFVVDGKAMKPPAGQEGFLYKNSTYVPLRFLAYSLGKAVSWDEATYTVTLSDPDKAQVEAIVSYREERVLGAKIAPTPAEVIYKPEELGVYFDEVKYVFDGKAMLPPQDLPGLIYHDTLYVPLRFISEALGKKVGWEPNSFTISLEGTPLSKPAETVKSDEKVKSEVLPPKGNTGSSTGGGGGGPTTPAKPSKDELVLVTAAELYGLQAQVKEQFAGLKTRYQSATAEQKESIKREANTLLAQTDGKVDTILRSLESKLSANGYDTAVVNEIKQKYEEIKAEEKAKLTN
ncbi:copper amine oxidase N-terminal domain-containing protein [Gorillibacterium sp. sgz5001074]|uniref:copper amine oxidase N-terminal domain-containing protein n=1 Tax=Gorillibacterium sp. sgz5001074 TaxID=3446695 RepID=UPI003F665585